MYLVHRDMYVELFFQFGALGCLACIVWCPSIYLHFGVDCRSTLSEGRVRGSLLTLSSLVLMAYPAQYR